MTWTDSEGGDHEGEDWAPDNADIICGIHYNVGTFTIANGYTVHVFSNGATKMTTGTALYVYADTHIITGTIQGDGKGFAGGGDTSTGLGDGGGSGDIAYSGGGAGYGGDGGNATAGGDGGNAYGVSDSAYIQRGSGGGGGNSSTSDGRAGGNGGGLVALYGNTVTVGGTITCNGQGGYTSVGNAGGGGSGGGVFLCGGAITVSGTLSANGGNGGNGSSYDGGRGGGGRIKILYDTLNTTGSTISAVYATFGGSVGVGDGTSTNTIIGQCTATRAYGQKFAFGERGVLSKVTLYANTVNTSDDFTLKVWDDESKGSEYGSKTVNINSAGTVEFEFASWISIAADTSYYFELNPDTTGDIELGVKGNLYATTGDYWENGYIVTYFDTYHILTGIMRVKGALAYNTADATVKCNLTNLMLIGAVHLINVDGTGTVQYIDDFTTNKYLGDYTALSDVTRDATDDELDIADSGYISYTIDTKYPVTGIPTLTATINITAGAPTIKISGDNVTYYDIDTAIVDNVSTSYPLDNATSLSLKGLTTFYLKLDCAGDGTNTCSVITMQLDVATVTETAENPLIKTGAANTFRLDQDSDSGLDCAVALTFEDRKWAS